MTDWQSSMEDVRSDDSTPIRPQRLAAEISRAASPGTIYVCDTGTVTVWAARHLDIKAGDRFTLSANLASMAYAVPGAIGAQLLYPDHTVVALTGDGGFTMLIGDLITAVTLDLPLVIVVFNNSKLGLIQMEQEAKGLPEYATHLANPDLAEVAKSMGAQSWRVEDPAHIGPALEMALQASGPAVLDVVVEPEEMTIPPKVKFSQVANFAKAKIKEMAGLGDGDAGLSEIKKSLSQFSDQR